MIVLGNSYRDRVTGFAGIATGYATYLTGCDRVCLEAPAETSGRPVDSQWIDAPRLDQEERPAVEVGIELLDARPGVTR